MVRAEARRDTACLQSCLFWLLFLTADTVTRTRTDEWCLLTCQAELGQNRALTPPGPGLSPISLSALLTGGLRHTRHGLGHSPGLREPSEGRFWLTLPQQLGAGQLSHHLTKASGLAMYLLDGSTQAQRSLWCLQGRGV